MKELIFTVFLLIAALTLKAQTNDMFLESESRYSFDETVNILT